MRQHRVYPDDPVDELGNPQIDREAGQSQGLVARHSVGVFDEIEHLGEEAWIEGRNFLTETGTRPLTGPAYGGRLSEGNARLLARFNAHIGVSAGPLRAVPVAALTP